MPLSYTPSQCPEAGEAGVGGGGGGCVGPYILGTALIVGVLSDCVTWALYRLHSVFLWEVEFNCPIETGGLWASVYLGRGMVEVTFGNRPPCVYSRGTGGSGMGRTGAVVFGAL